MASKQSFFGSLRSTIGISCALLLACVLGYVIGRTVSIQAHFQPEPLRLEADTRPLVPTVVIDGLRDGQLIGEKHGALRLVMGDHVSVESESGSFALAADSLLYHEVSVIVPDGVQYVASKRGSRAYLVTSPAGERLKPENRVYFVDREAAEAAGYKVD